MNYLTVLFSNVSQNTTAQKIAYYRGEKMKTLLGLWVALTASFAFADRFPSVGDKAVYHVEITQGNVTTSPYDTSTEVTAVDQAASTMTLVTAIIVNGQVIQSQSDTTPISTYTDLSSSVEHCASASGTLEKLTTPAGTFDTCHINQTIAGISENLWYANVPFGLVKSVTNQNGMQETMILTSLTSHKGNL